MQKSDFIEFLGLVADGQEILDEIVVEVATSDDKNTSRAEKRASKINNQGPEKQIEFLYENLLSIEDVCSVVVSKSSEVPTAFKAVVEAAAGYVEAYHKDLFVHDLVAIRKHDGPFLYFCRSTGSNIFPLIGWPVSFSENDKDVIATFLRSNEFYFHWDGATIRSVSKALVEKLMSR